MARKSTFRISFPAKHVDVRAESESEAYWQLARYFGKMSDGAEADDPEFEQLGMAHADTTIAKAPKADTSEEGD